MEAALSSVGTRSAGLSELLHETGGAGAPARAGTEWVDGRIVILVAIAAFAADRTILARSSGTNGGPRRKMAHRVRRWQLACEDVTRTQGAIFGILGKAPGIILAPRVVTVLTFTTPSNLMTGTGRGSRNVRVRPARLAESAHGSARTMPDNSHDIPNPGARSEIARQMTRSLARKSPESATKCHENRTLLVTTSHVAISRCGDQSLSPASVPPLVDENGRRFSTKLRPAVESTPEAFLDANLPPTQNEATGECTGLPAKCGACDQILWGVRTSLDGR